MVMRDLDTIRNQEIFLNYGKIFKRINSECMDRHKIIYALRKVLAFNAERDSC